MKCETCKMKRACDELERMGKVPKHEKCRCYSPTKPITNADRIRVMTDEELAEWLDNIDTAYEPESVVSRHGWLDWLRQEAET